MMPPAKPGEERILPGKFILRSEDLPDETSQLEVKGEMTIKRKA